MDDLVIGIEDMSSPRNTIRTSWRKVSVGRSELCRGQPVTTLYWNYIEMQIITGMIDSCLYQQAQLLPKQIVVLVYLHKGPSSVKETQWTFLLRTDASADFLKSLQEAFVHLLPLSLQRRAELNHPFWHWFPECPWAAEKYSARNKLNI